MEKEVSYSVELGATLAIIAALLAIVFLTVTIGHGVKADAYDSANRVLVDISSGNMNDVIGLENKMSTAAAYSLIRTNSQVIGELECYDSSHTGKLISNPSTDSSICLMGHMRGRVGLEVSYENESWYKVKVHDEDCPWFYGGCTCY